MINDWESENKKKRFGYHFMNNDFGVTQFFSRHQFSAFSNSVS